MALVSSNSNTIRRNAYNECRIITLQSNNISDISSILFSEIYISKNTLYCHSHNKLSSIKHKLEINTSNVNKIL